MKPLSACLHCSLVVVAILMLPPTVNAAPANAMVRVTCEDADKGADVAVDGKFKGECPVDIMLPEGTHKFRVSKKVNDTQDRVFEQEVRLGGGTSKKIDVVLSGPQANAASKRAADAANGERYKKAEAALASLIQQAKGGDAAAKKELATSYSQDSKGCYFYNAVSANLETVTWSGGCRNGLTTGTGEWARYRDGVLYARYVGAVVAGREEGPGRIEYARGEKFEGTFEDGYRTGAGVQYLDNGHYEGNFTKGMRQGFGKYFWNNGDRYEGAWDINMMTGTGTYYDRRGAHYVGEFQKGKWHGKGTLFFADGDRWEGTFENGEQKEGRDIPKGQ